MRNWQAVLMLLDDVVPTLMPPPLLPLAGGAGGWRSDLCTTEHVGGTGHYQCTCSEPGTYGLLEVSKLLLKSASQ